MGAHLERPQQRLVYQLNREKIWIEAWGTNSLRVRCTMNPEMPTEDWALSRETAQQTTPTAAVALDFATNTITNGRLSATINERGGLVFKKDGQPILTEFYRTRAIKKDTGNEEVGVEKTSGFSSALKLKSREFTYQQNGSYGIKQRFEAQAGEKIYGMGQYQQPFLDLKGCQLELAQRNSQATVPFYLSSLGYGFLWNNPGLGEVTFAKNKTEWTLTASEGIDYWLTVADTPAELLTNYTAQTGRSPLFPQEHLGLWQSKMRYQSQAELLAVAQQYQQKGITPSVLVIDYFHWTEQGNYDFDPEFWPDIPQLVQEMKAWGIELMISIWPTVAPRARYFEEMEQQGLLIEIKQGLPYSMHLMGNTKYIDPTNQRTRDYVWQRIKANYYEQGLQLFWLDVAEPSYTVYDFDNYRYHKGDVTQVGNIYPRDYLKMIYQGVAAEGREQFSLVRCAWAGSQKFGALVWSGDIDTNFTAFKNQINAGLNMGLAGIPWWTTDIGGFEGGEASDPEFRELMVRWFQYATFSPVLRMHGDRAPHVPPLPGGKATVVSGADNEIWSYGAINEAIFTDYLKIRANLTDYLYELGREASRTGAPLMRPLFYEFPEDQTAWERENFVYMLGPALLIAPVTDYQQTERTVYLPAGEQWLDLFDGGEYEGGQDITVACPLEKIPVFIRKNYPAPGLQDLLAAFP